MFSSATARMPRGRDAPARHSGPLDVEVPPVRLQMAFRKRGSPREIRVQKRKLQLLKSPAVASGLFGGVVPEDRPSKSPGDYRRRSPRKEQLPDAISKRDDRRGATSPPSPSHTSSSPTSRSPSSTMLVLHESAKTTRSPGKKRKGGGSETIQHKETDGYGVESSVLVRLHGEWGEDGDGDGIGPLGTPPPRRPELDQARKDFVSSVSAAKHAVSPQHDEATALLRAELRGLSPATVRRVQTLVHLTSKDGAMSKLSETAKAALLAQSEAFAGIESVRVASEKLRKHLEAAKVVRSGGKLVASPRAAEAVASEVKELLSSWKQGSSDAGLFGSLNKIVGKHKLHPSHSSSPLLTTPSTKRSRHPSSLPPRTLSSPPPTATDEERKERREEVGKGERREGEEEEEEDTTGDEVSDFWASAPIPEPKAEDPRGARRGVEFSDDVGAGVDPIEDLSFMPSSASHTSTRSSPPPTSHPSTAAAAAAAAAAALRATPHSPSSSSTSPKRPRSRTHSYADSADGASVGTGASAPHSIGDVPDDATVFMPLSIEFREDQMASATVEDLFVAIKEALGFSPVNIAINGVTLDGRDSTLLYRLGVTDPQLVVDIEVPAAIARSLQQSIDNLDEEEDAREAGTGERG